MIRGPLSLNEPKPSGLSNVIAHLRALTETNKAGARLPSVRDLMEHFAVSPVTVRKAIFQLSQMGMLEARPGLGLYVAHTTKNGAEAGSRHDHAWQALALGPRRASADAVMPLLRAPQDRIINLGNGYLPDALQATRLLDDAAKRALRQSNIWSRAPLEGIPPLRELFARETGGAFTPHEVTVCPGTQSALSASFRALTSPGDQILMESPTYTGAIAAARAFGLTIIPVPTDLQGVRTDVLEDVLRKSGARVFYIQPMYANPTGVTLAAARRRDLLALIRKYNVFLIEDDWARDFCLGDEVAPMPMAAGDHDGHIIYVRSLTKSAAPGLRVGVVCARGPALERLRAARAVEDFFVSGLLQQTTMELITNSAWRSHLRRLRIALRERRDALIHAIHYHLGPEALTYKPHGGLHLWIRLPNGVSDAQAADRAANENVTVSPGWHWFPTDTPGGYLRLSFATLPPENYDDAIARLKSAISPQTR